jgi:hypothetical protein
MKTNLQTKKLGEILVGIVFIISVAFLFVKEEYWLGFFLLIALIPLLRIEALTELVFNAKDGLCAKFVPSPKKIEQDLKENKQPNTKQNFSHFSHIEAKILSSLQKRYGGEIKTQVHFMYGEVDRPEFRYTPDGSLRTRNTLYLFEIKYVLKTEFAKEIIKNTSSYLETFYKKFNPVAGKRLVMKLILASSQDIDISNFEVPDGVELEFFKV